MTHAFAFGRNWRRFLAVVDEERVADAEGSLRRMLPADGVAGRTWLDVGCGSGLFSLAAARLGARVTAFDYDADAVACAEELRRRCGGGALPWRIERGSVLDPAFLATLGRFDVVYAWGVLHHTGRLWEAVDNAAALVADGGRLWLAIYNDQGRASRSWLAVKRLYGRLPGPGRALLVGAVGTYFALRGALGRAARRENPLPLRATRRRGRGMAWRHDLVDWVGGLPFEVARPEEVFDVLRARGFRLERLATQGGGHGCNEFVFVREPPAGG